MDNNDLLRYAVQNGIIDIMEVTQKAQEMEREKQLKQHPYEFWQAKDGSWRTYLPNGDKRKVMQRKTKRALQDALIAFYNKDVEEKETKCRKELRITFKELFEEWIRYKQLHTSASSYVKRIIADYNKFYKDLENEIVQDFDTLFLDKWIHGIIKKYNLTKKEYYNMSIIIRQSLQFAIECNYIEESPYDKVKVSSKMLRTKKKDVNTNQVFLKKEHAKFVEQMELMRHNNPDDVSPLAIMLCFETGMRVGELCVVKTTDIQGNYLHVHRQMVRDFEYTDSTHMKMVGWKVVDYTKSEDGDREIYLTKRALEIIKQTIKTNKQYGNSKGKYLFVKGNEIITPTTLDTRITSGCKKCGISVKRMHKIRKTYISILIDSGLNIDEIRRQAGHSDERTTLKNYSFNRLENEETELTIEDALANPFKPFQKSYQN